MTVKYCSLFSVTYTYFPADLAVRLGGDLATAVVRANINKPSVMKSFILLTSRLIPFQPSWTDLNYRLEN